MTDAIQATVLLCSAVAAALFIDIVVVSILRHVAKRTGSELMRVFIRRMHQPGRVLLAALAVLFAMPAARLSEDIRDPLSHGVGLVALAAVGWLVAGATYVTEALILRHYDVNVPDNVVARRAKTQTTVLRRIIIFVIAVIIASVMLMTFARARALGASMLASAGLAGLVIGLAARPTLENIMAGLQIAFGNSLRLDDVVIVEEEYGRVEEITLTYVVVRTWDERRIILPISYFVTTPFQNWTRQEAHLLGTVYMYVDYQVPVEEMRTRLTAMLSQSPDWDGRVGNVQVVDTTERALQVRILVSARDAGTLWSLRCAVREGMVDFLRSRFPAALPRARVEMTDPEGAPWGTQDGSGGHSSAEGVHRP